MKDLSERYKEYKEWLNEVPEISDEQIEEALEKWIQEDWDDDTLTNAFRKGAKWYREQLKLELKLPTQEMKKSPVEWLIEKVNSDCLNSTFISPSLVKEARGMMKLDIVLDEYNYDCSDGCCTHYGTVVKVNGEELPLHNEDTETILKQVLEHLGYEVKLTSLYNSK